MSDGSTDVLSPINFLIPKTSVTPENVDCEISGLEMHSTKSKKTMFVLRRFQKTEKTLEKFWKLWRNDYLTLLRERMNTAHREGKFPELAPGIHITTRQDEEVTRLQSDTYL